MSSSSHFEARRDGHPLAARLLALYPALADLPPDRLQSDLSHETLHLPAVPSGTRLFDEGEPCRGFPMLLSGEVRVARGGPEGRSLELYRVVPGDVCVASTSCLFGERPLVAHGATSQPSELAVLSPRAFGRWTGHEGFRRYVFGVFADRLADLMGLAEAVAFQRLDQRLAAALLGHGPVRLGTQQALADELGTVREIVTRLLRRFERAGWIRTGRERIEVQDAAALRRLAAGGPGWPRSQTQRRPARTVRPVAAGADRTPPSPLSTRRSA